MSKMRAMVIPEAGGQFRMEERDLPEPGRHEVRIRVQACGVCHSDSVTVSYDRMISGKARFRVVLKIGS